MVVSQDPAPSRSQEVDTSTAWGFGQGTHRNSGGQGAATLRVQEPSAGDRRHGHLGQERFFLERFRTREKPEMLGSSRNTPVPQGRQEVSSRPTTQVGPPSVRGPTGLGSRELVPDRLCLGFPGGKVCDRKAARPRPHPRETAVRSQGPLPENGVLCPLWVPHSLGRGRHFCGSLGS